MGTEDSKHRPAHILVFPYPAQGHLLPLLDLAHHLSLRRNLTVTVITTPKNLPALSPLFSPTLHALTLPFPSHPSLPPGPENIEELGIDATTAVISALTQLSPLIAGWFGSHPEPPLALISDFFLGWTVSLARDLNIPCLTFFSSGLLLNSISDRCWTNLDAVKKMDVVEFPDLPGSPSFRQEHLPGTFKFYKAEDPDWEVVKESMLANLSSYGCIFNSLEAVEGKYLNHPKKKDRIYTVGPISQLGSNRSEPSPHSRVFEWLDACPEGSVLYVCFGSQAVLSQEQVEGLAEGLERSRARFVWVVRSNGPANVPADFEEWVSGRGLVIKGWAPQARILKHNAVGGFLSHCGWNSILEGIMGGVTFLTWPMGADQHINAWLLEEELQVGKRAFEGDEWVPDPAELARVIGKWSGASGKAWKARVSDLRVKALGAVGEGGTSMRDLDRLVMDLLQLRVN